VEKPDLSLMFPKNLRNKAKLMLNNIKDVNLNDNNRIIYPDKTVGSNIFDLVKYFVSDINFSPARPLDSEKFETLLDGVPLSAFGRGRKSRVAEHKMKWKTLYH
jgi:hypothetical protein